MRKVDLVDAKFDQGNRGLYVHGERFGNFVQALLALRQPQSGVEGDEERCAIACLMLVGRNGEIIRITDTVRLNLALERFLLKLAENRLPDLKAAGCQMTLARKVLRNRPAAMLGIAKDYDLESQRCATNVRMCLGDTNSIATIFGAVVSEHRLIQRLQWCADAVRGDHALRSEAERLIRWSLVNMLPELCGYNLVGPERE